MELHFRFGRRSCSRFELRFSARHGFWLFLTALCFIGAYPLTWTLVFGWNSYDLITKSWWIVFGALVVAMLVMLVAVVCLAFWTKRCIEVTGSNAFGWAHGHRDGMSNAAVPPLVDWLHQRIQAAASLDVSAPLTFGHLESCGLPAGQDPVPGDERVGVTLRMNTTCLTLNRPFTLPFEPNPTMDFYFKLCDFRKYFPPEVTDYLTDDARCPEHPQNPAYRRFPSKEALPVVVAARMSMSFPILFSAVRLYVEDHENEMQPIWFSDGGLTINMPIHFFDGPIPRWPTFAIDLLGSDPDSRRSHGANFREDDVFIEGDVATTAIEPWDRLNDSLFQFVGAIVETARTWQDRLLGHTPGYADRTVGIRLKSTEGGLNLTMPSAVITSLTDRGDQAGMTLVDRFAPAAEGWPSQRWTRYRNTMKMFSIWLRCFELAYRWTGVKPSYPPFIETTIAKLPHSDAEPWANDVVARTAREDTDTVDALRGRWGTPFEEGAAEPTADLVSRPPH